MATGLKARLIGLVLVAVGGGFAWFFAWRPLAEAQAGAQQISFPTKVFFLAPLAVVFGLSRAEALLLDIRSADRGHCLVIDIRASYGRSRRRLISVETAQERQLLDRVGLVFENVDCGPGGPEGNYRQRLYRLRTLLPEAGAEGGVEDGDDTIARPEPDGDYSLAA